MHVDWRKVSRSLQYWKRLAVDWILPIGAPGQAMQAVSITGTGANPLTVTFADQQVNGETMKDMETTDYLVLKDGVFAGTVTIPEANKAAASFRIAGLANAEICHCIIIGRWKDMPDPNAA
jgi:hypothetical protein